jgi:hypothetical protein
VLVLVLVGGVLLMRGGSDESVIDEPEPTLDVHSLEWTMIEFDESLVGQDVATLASVTAGGPGFVAVGGTDCIPGEGCESAAVWTSTDGTAWSRVPHDPEVFSGTSGLRLMRDVTVGGPGLVAVGYGVDEPDRPGPLNPVVWVSEDGYEWSRVPIPGNGRIWLRSVTAGGPGLVAVGMDYSAAAVWTSIDGINWDRVPHDPAVFGGGFPSGSDSEMMAVTVGGPGLVAVGFVDGDSNTAVIDSIAAVWVSTDGFTWSRIPHDEEVFGGDGNQAINDVVAGGPGLVAVGTDTSSGAAVWTSPDGITWTRVPHDPILFGKRDGNRWMDSVVTYGNGLVAGGTDLWTSSDGLTWTVVQGIPGSDAPLEEPESWRMGDITTGRHGIVAVGSSGDYSPYAEEKPQAVVWTAKRIIDAPPNVETPLSNGDFEAGDLTDWTDWEGSGWLVYEDPLAPNRAFLHGSPVGGMLVLEFDPPQGAYAAVSTNQPGTHVLYRDFMVDGPSALRATVFYNKVSLFGETYLFSQYQYRVDLIDPAAPVDSLADEDVLGTVFQTKGGDPLSLEPTEVTYDLSPWQGKTIRLRAIEISNEQLLFAGLDNVRIEPID